MPRRLDNTVALAGDSPDNGRQLRSLVIVVTPADENVISVVNDAVEARPATDVEDDAVD